LIASNALTGYHENASDDTALRAALYAGLTHNLQIIKNIARQAVMVLNFENSGAAGFIYWFYYISN
jgi:hypothetical protein